MLLALTLASLTPASTLADDPRFHARYDAVRGALASDDDAAAGRAARALTEVTSAGPLQDATRRLAGAQGLEARRAAFARVSELAIEAGLARGRIVWRCPMAPGRPRWIQRSGEPAGNPYLGRAMPTCGEATRADVRSTATSDTVLGAGGVPAKSSSRAVRAA
jgi:hypothetical protein